MKQSIEIRPAVPADMEAVGRLYTDSWQRTYRGLLPDQELDEMTAEASTEKWTSYLERKENAMFVLERNGAVAGFAACRPPSRAGEQRSFGFPPCGPGGPGGRLGPEAHCPGSPLGEGAGIPGADSLCGAGQSSGGASLPEAGSQRAVLLPRLGRRPLLGAGLGGFGGFRGIRNE